MAEDDLCQPQIGDLGDTGGIEHDVSG